MSDFLKGLRDALSLIEARADSIRERVGRLETWVERIDRLTFADDPDSHESRLTALEAHTNATGEATVVSSGYSHIAQNESLTSQGIRKDVRANEMLEKLEAWINSQRIEIEKREDSFAAGMDLAFGLVMSELAELRAKDDK